MKWRKCKWPQGIIGWISLFKRKICYFRVLWCIKRESPFEYRLRVVPHFSLGIVERAKRERAWKSPHARKGDTAKSISIKFPECKQMINEAWVFSNCLFVFFRSFYLPMEIILSRSRTVKRWIPRKTKYFHVFYCSAMSKIFADSRMELRRYRRMDINVLNVVPEKFSLDLKV